MKIEKRKLTYFINGTKFIDLDCLGYAVQQKLFNSSSYQYLLKSHKKKGDKANLISLKVFQEILRKHPKKQPCWCLSGLNFIDCHFNKEKKVKMTLFNCQNDKCFNNSLRMVKNAYLYFNL